VNFTLSKEKALRSQMNEKCTRMNTTNEMIPRGRIESYLDFALLYQIMMRCFINEHISVYHFHAYKNPIIGCTSSRHSVNNNILNW